jgi:4-hydroxy-3-methylbut-2-en-1-yl diphosphate synthase IspG/GcpE
LLTRIPEAPVQNPAVGDLEYNGQKWRTLTFERERNIVNNLAFLSTASDNPEKVTAICIEKHANAYGYTVRIAVNKGSLNFVEEGF